MELRFDRIYPHIHFIPMDRQGIRLLRILSLPDCCLLYTSRSLS